MKKARSSQSTYLIIGNSIAGVKAIEGIREVDSSGRVIVVTDEHVKNYSRPLISYYVGMKVSADRMPFKEFSFYSEQNVDLRLGTTVTQVDTIHKRALLAPGGWVSFDKLLIATGGKPFVPPITGLRDIEQGVFTFTTLEDSQRLINYVETNTIKHAVILGAGLIGLKCAEGLVARGLKVTLVELADRVLANTFDLEASRIIERALAGWGCEVIKQNTINQLQQHSSALTGVIPATGQAIATKLLVVAIGVSPNIDLVASTDIAVNRGILVDNHMETNIPGIFAAGDVAEAKNLLSHQTSVIAIWPVAAQQGYTAGLNMAGSPTEYSGSFPMNSIELAGIPTISFGVTNPADTQTFEILARKDPNDAWYRKIVLKDNRVVGAIFLGRIERAGIFSGLIKNQVDVASFKGDFLSDDFGLLILPAQYRKHLVQGEGIEV